VPRRDRGDPQAPDRNARRRVKDGMIVHTQSERARTASSGPSDVPAHQPSARLPVCDKGGECRSRTSPSGWGGGQLALHRAQRAASQAAPSSRPRRDSHRERASSADAVCRYSQADLRRTTSWILLERGANSFVGHLRRHPVRRALQRNIIELFPVRRAHLAPLPFPRAAMGDPRVPERCGTALPLQCNVTLTVA